ncbi:MAG: cell division protein SepF [Firmicutes bacterium]|nr:cell division protein SepF [Dethiobacter sp.]MBS3888564.1 cell division protein SepF [Bacillota bacterium]
MREKSRWRKFLDFFGFDSDDDEEEDTRREPLLPEDAVSDLHSQRRPQQVVDLAKRQQMRVVVVQPSSFDDVPNIVEHVKARRPVIINLDICDQKGRQRILDFMSGATYGSGGRMQKISEAIFLSAPSTVQIDNITGEIYDDGLASHRPSQKKGN